VCVLPLAIGAARVMLRVLKDLLEPLFAGER